MSHTRGCIQGDIDPECECEQDRHPFEPDYRVVPGARSIVEIPYTFWLDIAIVENDDDVAAGMMLTGFELDEAEKSERELLRDLDAAIDRAFLFGVESPVVSEHKGLTQHQIEVRLATNGMRHPIWTYEIAHKVGLRIYDAAAMLMMETGGGRNEFGHDWDFQWAGATVTKARYEALRADIRAGRPSNGVGPCQLTWTGYLDEADKLGGAWKIPVNMQVGFGALKGLIDQHGQEGGFAAYNGTGAAAEEYGRRAVAYAEHFQRLVDPNG